MQSTVYFPKTKKYPITRTWNLSDIWKESEKLEVIQVKVNYLWDSRYKDAWCWQHENEKINNIFFLNHMRRVLNADLNYPIILSEEELIFDGVHRLMKAKHLGLEYIDCVMFEKDPIANI